MPYIHIEGVTIIPFLWMAQWLIFEELNETNVTSERNKIILTFATTVSRLKMCDFSGETFKAFEVL